MRDSLKRGTMDEGHCIFPRRWATVYFTVNELIASTFVERLSSGGC